MKEDRPEKFVLPAHDAVQVAELVDGLLNQVDTVRYQDIAVHSAATAPLATPSNKLGKNGVHLAITEQFRTGVAAVYQFPREVAP